MIPITHARPVVRTNTSYGEQELSLAALAEFQKTAEQNFNYLRDELAVHQNSLASISVQLRECRMFIDWVEGAHPDIASDYRTHKRVLAAMDRADQSAQAEQTYAVPQSSGG